MAYGRGDTGRAGGTLQALLDKLDQADAWVRERPLAWPAVLLVTAVLMWISALILQPLDADWVYLGGRQLGETCAMIQVTGQPCPSCGMTRSFVWAARFGFEKSFFYNPAGLVLFWSITAGGAVGALRLARRDPNYLALPYNRMVALVLSWTVFLYVVPWLLRMWGINPLP